MSFDVAGKVSLLTNGAIIADGMCPAVRVSSGAASGCVLQHSPRQSYTTPATPGSLVARDEALSDGKELPYPEFSPGPFEGVEKHLIVQFDEDFLMDCHLLVKGSLRSLQAEQWQNLVDKAACQILSSTALETPNGGCTAYLLSESSLFVYDSKVILKTCGTTTPLLALPVLLGFVPGTLKTRCRSGGRIDVQRVSVTNSLQTVQSQSTLASCAGGEEISSKPFDMSSPSFLLWDTDSDSGSPFASDSEGCAGYLQASVEDLASISISPSRTPERSSSPPSPMSGCPSVGGVSTRCDVGCGSSTASHPAEPIESIDVTGVAWMVFSHLSYCQPERQRYPHRSFQEELDYLDGFFDGVGGRTSYGTLETSASKEFCFYAYHKGESAPGFTRSEVIMLGIDEMCVKTFADLGSGYNVPASRDANAPVYRLIGRRGPGEALHHMEERTNQRGGVANELKHPRSSLKDSKSSLDEFWFDPCGYSCNGLIDSTEREAHYVDVHISPEPASSYASVEATYPFACMDCEHGSDRGSPDLCLSAADVTASFKPASVHLVELVVNGLESRKAAAARQRRVSMEGFATVEVKEHDGSWFSIRHAEYQRVK